MADDLDVEAMLEAPYRKEEDSGRSKDKEKDRDRDKRRRSRSRDKDKDKDKKKSRDKDGHKHKHKKRSRSQERDDKKSRKRSRSRERDRERRKKSKSPYRRHYSPSPVRVPEPDLNPEERDARTVFCMQLSARIRPRDLEEFFSSVGKVKDVRIITDNKTRRSKGIAYIEFQDLDSVPLAMGLTGQRLLGVPIIVQASQAEKNRLASMANMTQKGNSGPMRLYVGSLHFNITEDMLRGIFEPFGKIDQVDLVMDNGRSKGFGFVTFHNAEDAKKALEQLNGFELAGRPMKVGHVTERTADNQGSSLLDSDEMDRAGVDLGATGRLQLMAKLAEGTGFEIPKHAANALNLNPGGGGTVMPAPQQQQQQQSNVTPPIATQCFMLSNMFDPINESSPSWEVEIRDDVIEECNKHGGVLHIYVDKASPQGNVYIKCPSIAAAVASVQALHGRWFAGKMITAAYVPLANYHALFPDATRTVQLLIPSTQSVQTVQQSFGLGLNPGLGNMSGLAFQ